MAEPETEMTLRRHLAVLRNPSAPDRARRISENALFTALGGGYGPEQRLQIVQGQLGNVDIGYDSLLVKHLEAIRDEAIAIGRHKLAERAEELLTRVVE